MSWYRVSDKELVLELYVQPGATRTAVTGPYGERLKLRLSARAIDGSANACLVEFIAKRLNVAKRDVTIVSGSASRHKRVVVCGARRSPEALWSLERRKPSA